MADVQDRKLFLGPRLRMLRRELGLSQTRMAEEIGISASYLNHLERNQRPVTAQLLLRLAGTYDIDMRDFMAGSGDAAIGGLVEIFNDPLARDAGVTRDEIIDISENYPAVGEVLQRFHRALADMRGEPDLIERLRQGGGATPLDWLRDTLQGNRNHFAPLDEAMEKIGDALPADPVDLDAALRARLAGDHQIGTRVVPAHVIDGARRHFDLHRRRLMLSETLSPESRRFALAHHVAQVEGAEVIAGIVDRAAPPGRDHAALLRMALAAYGAAALVMPYGRILRAARESRHDLTLMARRFGVSMEQLCHRLTTLGRTAARGVPFFMLKVDGAGNVAKRFASESFPFAQLGGACPRWGLFAMLGAPDQTRCEIIELPDGKRFLTLLHGQIGPAGRPTALALGCELRHAEQVAAADGLGEQAVLIGPACHLCERPACPDRIAPPANRGLDVTPLRRDASPYPFRPVR